MVKVEKVIEDESLEVEKFSKKVGERMEERVVIEGRDLEDRMVRNRGCQMLDLEEIHESGFLC